MNTSLLIIGIFALFLSTIFIFAVPPVHLELTNQWNIPEYFGFIAVLFCICYSFKRNEHNVLTKQNSEAVRE